MGRLLSVAIMIVGISLFFRLAQAVFRPGGKVRFPARAAVCSGTTRRKVPGDGRMPAGPVTSATS